MKLIEDITCPSYTLTSSQDSNSKECQTNFLKPFRTFKNSVNLSIKIHFFRFIFVAIIYYFSEVFLFNQRQTAQPWNSLLYFLAIMIQIIKFIGDYSLRNLIKTEEKKLLEIHQLKLKIKNTHINSQNVTLKGAKYQDYMHIFSIINIFKYKHKNYSSAFSISKYMHLICTFLIFGRMSLAEQYKIQVNWIQLVVLQIFLYSIYFTSFEIDLYLIQTSEGRSLSLDRYRQTQLSVHQSQIVIGNFKKWRNTYLVIQSIGTILVLLGIVINMKINLLFLSVVFVGVINAVGFQIQKNINRKCSSVTNRMHRYQINTYSVLKKSVSEQKINFKSFVILQRFFYVFFWFAYVRDQSVSLYSSYFLGFGLIILIISQIKKFSMGNKLKLMSIVQGSLNVQKEAEKFKECAICLKIFEKGDIASYLPCSKDHVYHYECFQEWKKIKTQCPLCRYPLQDYI